MKQHVKLLVLTLILALVVVTGLISGCTGLTTTTTGSTPPVTQTVATTAPGATATVTTTQTPTVTQSPSGSITGTASFAPGSDPLPDIESVVALVKPSVVVINTQVPVTGFFGQQSTEQAAGSGWILDSNGTIVTNNHVVDGATTISVTLDDGRTFSVDPSTVKADTINDLAILHIDATGLPALKIGDSTNLKVGQWVVAIGNSLGMGIRATVGIVSQLGVTLDISTDQALYNLIDTSAIINPGNSGGPLVNLSGQVIGITNAKIVETGAEATGFAIPSESAVPIINQLITNGYVTRPFLGVQGLITVDSMVASYYRLSTDSGVLVRGVVAGSPAADAGLKSGDIITQLGGSTVTTLNELTKVLYQAEIGQPLSIGYNRNGKETTTTITPIASPAPTASGSG